MSFSLVEGWTEQEKRALAKAMCESKDPDCIMNAKLEHMYPTAICQQEYDAMKLAEKEHAPNVAVRITDNFKVQYYNTETGEIVSTHL